ncbi:hypothetical protein B0T17DRAFT_498869 [Bombardia bombarda]|uniref:C2H2 type master regulator of conidiophore development brlA n=1 Tax=Bombardia bombarda TaxID=252184 RepID=A0AA39TQ46_9PEZI|nr:hypothetical protein B0T17DRAFT_498869 [Bombardia bombarda]
MHARDSYGRSVSLLNDDASSRGYHHPVFRRSYQDPIPQYDSPSPNTPELLRSDSYDSHISNEPLSPMTPAYDYAAAAPPTFVDPQYSYEDYMDPSHGYVSTKRPRTLSDSRSTSYEDNDATSPGAERSGKRYPCRYRETHGCEKTFTTSGHASRHSKIHTAEKAVPCSFHTCSKKFTRADNMKQHLETHYKDRSRPSSSRLSVSSSSDKKSSSLSGKPSSSRPSKAAISGDSTMPLPSPGGVFDMRELNFPLPHHCGRPSAAVRTPSSGLDALALAVAFQGDA